MPPRLSLRLFKKFATGLRYQCWSTTRGRGGRIPRAGLGFGLPQKPSVRFIPPGFKCYSRKSDARALCRGGAVRPLLHARFRILTFLRKGSVPFRKVVAGDGQVLVKVKLSKMMVREGPSGES